MIVMVFVVSPVTLEVQQIVLAALTLALGPREHPPKFSLQFELSIAMKSFAPPPLFPITLPPPFTILSKQY
jgi:hypothetical protein